MGVAAVDTYMAGPSWLELSNVESVLELHTLAAIDTEPKVWTGKVQKSQTEEVPKAEMSLLAA